MRSYAFDWPPKRFSFPKAVPVEETTFKDDSFDFLSSLPLVQTSDRDQFTSSIFASLSQNFEADDADSLEPSTAPKLMDLTSGSKLPNGDALHNPRGQQPNDSTTSQELTIVQSPPNETYGPGASLKYTSSGSTTRSKHSEGTVVQSTPSSRSSLDDNHGFPYCSSTSPPVKPGSLQSKTITATVTSMRNQCPRKSTVSRKSTRSYGVPTVIAYKNKPLPPEPSALPSELDLTRIDYRLLESVEVTTPEPPAASQDDLLGLGMDSVETVVQSRVAKGERPRSGGDMAPRPVSSYMLFGYHKDGVTYEAAERVVLKVLSSLQSLTDLQAVAMVNKTFYRMFRRYERSLVNRILFKHSLPAWELRQVMKCEQKRSAFRLKSVQRDAATVQAMQSFILMKCQALLRPSTIDGLLDNDARRKTGLDNAIWRIWTFCKLFGKRRAHAGDVLTQTIWLNGGERCKTEGKSIALGIGNGSGLTVSELEDMSEMWRCMEALLSEFLGREAEARAAGIFDQCSIDESSGSSETAFLQAWIHDILSLGPKAVLTLTSCSFEQARVLGVTRWSPPVLHQSQLYFMKSAIEHVYRERLVAEARQKANEYDKIMRSQSKQQRSSSSSGQSLVRSISEPPRLQVVTGQQVTDWTVQHQLKKSIEDDVVRPDCDPLSSWHHNYASNPPSAHPSDYSTLSMTQRATFDPNARSSPLAWTTSPSANLHEMSVYPVDDKLPAIDENTESFDIIDPVDKALEHLVRDKGYPETDVKRALSLSDDGRGVDLEKALNLLTSGSDMSMHVVNQQPKRTVELPTIPFKMPKFYTSSDSESGVGRRSTLPSAGYKRRSRLSVASIRRSFSLGVIADTEDDDNEGEEPGNDGTFSPTDTEFTDDSDCRARNASITTATYHKALAGISESSTKTKNKNVTLHSPPQPQQRAPPILRNGSSRSRRISVISQAAPARGIHQMQSFENDSPISPMTPVVGNGTPVSAVSTPPRSIKTPTGLMTFFLSSGDEQDRVVIKRKPVRQSSASSGILKGVRWKDRESLGGIGRAY